MFTRTTLAAVQTARTLVSRTAMLTHQTPFSLNSQIVDCNKVCATTRSETNYCQLAPFSSVQSQILPAKSNQVNLISRRYKKKRPQRAGDDDEEEDDDDDDLAGENPLLVDDLLNPVEDGSETITIETTSLRLDAMAKALFSVTRAKIEESFYKGDLLVNGQRPAKKSADVLSGDEIDLVKLTSPEDSKKLIVKRAIILSMPDKMSEHGRVKIKVKRWNDLTIDKPGVADNDESY